MVKLDALEAHVCPWLELKFVSLRKGHPHSSILSTLDGDVNCKLHGRGTPALSFQVGPSLRNV
jgi:hypothetical protein